MITNGTNIDENSEEQIVTLPVGNVEVKIITTPKGLVYLKIPKKHFLETEVNADEFIYKLV